MNGKKMKIRIGDLRVLIEQSLREEAEAPEAFSPKSEKSEVGDSIDAQLDRFLNEYETEAQKGSKNENLRFLIQSMLHEDANEEPKDHAEALKSLEQIDIESFANAVSHLIENFDSLVETKNSILRRAMNHLVKSYDESVKTAFEDTMREQHNTVLGKSRLDVEDDFQAPAADRAGPEIGGGGAGA